MRGWWLLPGCSLVGCVTLAGLEEGRPREEAPGAISGSSGQAGVGVAGQATAGSGSGSGGTSAGGAASQAGSGGAPVGGGQAGSAQAGGQAGGQAGSAQAGGQAGGQAGSAQAGGGQAGGGQAGSGIGGSASGPGGAAGGGGTAGGGGAGASGASGQAGGGPGYPLTAAPEVMWSRQYGTASDEATADLAADGEGGVLLAGEASGPLQVGGVPVGGAGVFVARVDAAGSAQWATRMTAGTVLVQRLIAAPGGGGYLLGVAGGKIEFPGATKGPLYTDPPEGGKGPFVARLAADGRPLWIKYFPAVAPSNGAATSLVVGDGEVLVAGTVVGELGVGVTTLQATGAPASFEPDVFVLRLGSESGEVLGAVSLGSAGADRFPQLEPVVGGALLVASCGGAVTLPGLGEQPCSGLLWSRLGGGLTFTQARSFAVEQATGLAAAVRPGGGLFVTGRYVGAAAFDSLGLDPAGVATVFLVALGPDGAPGAARTVSGAGRAQFGRVLTDADGGVLLGGWTSGKVPWASGQLTSAPTGERNSVVLKMSASLDPQVAIISYGAGKGLLHEVGGMARGLYGELFVSLTANQTFFLDTMSPYQSLGERDLVLVKFSP